MCVCGLAGLHARIRIERNTLIIIILILMPQNCRESMEVRKVWSVVSAKRQLNIKYYNHLPTVMLARFLPTLEPPANIEGMWQWR